MLVAPERGRLVRIFVDAPRKAGGTPALRRHRDQHHAHSVETLYAIGNSTSLPEVCIRLIKL
jgi:hypothetical protein